MNYKNWDNRKTNRGRGRGNNWIWRGRGYNRMTNPFLHNLWTNSSQNYNQYHLSHHEASAHYQNSRFPRLPIPPSNTTSVIVTKPVTPLPGSEEYTQNKIQQTSDLIKRQLNIDSETCASDFSSSLAVSDSSNNNVTEEQESNIDVNSLTRPSENKRVMKQLNRKNKTPEIIDVQEIHDRIIKHISNLSYSKKMNLVNQSTVGYDIAIHEVQKQKRLELSRALRDISKRQSQSSDDGEVINAIIPDIGIKIEDLPNDVIAELSNSLNLHLEDQVTSLVDPEVCFKQAEEILNVNFEGDESNLKMFEHNLKTNECINNLIRSPNQIHHNLHMRNIVTTDYDLLNKSNKGYDLDDNTFQNNHNNYEEYISKRSMENMFLDSSDTHNNDVNSDDDYSKDAEFNNFCFENLDVTKSYLTPFASIKSHPDEFVNDATVNNIPENIPKISVRKDILPDTTGSNSNDNLGILNSQSTSHSPVNISLSEQPHRKFDTDHSDSFNSIIESTNYLNKLQTHTFEQEENSNIQRKDIKCDSKWKDDSNIDENDKIIKDPVKTTNIPNVPVVQNYSKEEQLISFNTKDDLKHSNIVQKVETVTKSVHEKENIDRTLQTLESSSQKRWKSPGEKKMMTDIHLKSNITKDSEQTLNNTILEQMEEFNKKMMTITAESCNSCTDNFQKESENFVNIESTNDIDYFHSTDTLITLPIQTSENSNNVNYDNDVSKIEELSKTSLEETDCSKNMTQNILVNKMMHMPDNIQEIQRNDKNVITCSDNTKESVSNVDTEKNLNLDSKQKSYNVCQDIISSTKEDSNTDEPTNFNCVQKYTHDDSKQKEKLSKPKDGKYKKARCKSIHNTINNKHSTIKHKCTDIISSCVTQVNDINKNALNIKSDTNKTDKSDSEKTERNEVCRKIKTAAEKKETIPVLKSVHNVYVQTNFENESLTQDFQRQLKEYKNVEIQTSNLLSSSSVQTNTDIEVFNNELRHRNYLNSLLKLKGIDEEIQRLMNMKKNLYESMEYEYNITNCFPTHELVHSDRENRNKVKLDSGTFNAIHEKNEEGSDQRTFTDMLFRKHKKTASEEELEEGVRSPKRKKRHRNLLKNIISDTSAKTQLSSSSSTNNLQLLNKEENNCTNVRKPLSIKISLKNITQSSSMAEFQKTTEKIPNTNISEKINAKQNSLISSNNKSTNKQCVAVEKQSRKRNSVERKFEIDSRECTKPGSVSKLSSGSDAFSSNADLLPKGKNLAKVCRNKKLKISKHNISYSKMHKNNEAKLLDKSCHVIIERFTIDYLEQLKKSLRGTSNESHKSNLTEEKKTHSTDLYISNSASKTGEPCDPKETSIKNIHVNCDPNDIEFKNFTGAILDMQIVEDVLLAGTDSGYLYFFNINTGDNISSINISDKPLTSTCVLLNDGHLNIYTGCLKGNLTVIDFNSKEVSDIIQCEEGIQCIEKGWEFIFMGSNRGHVMRYNYKKTKLESSIEIYDSNILSIKATQEGARRVVLVASRNAQITVRDAMSGLLLRTMNSTFCPTVYTILLENNLVYCGTSQHNILIFTFQDGQLSHKYEAANSKGIVCLKITGNLLFAGCYNGNIYVYNIHSSKYLGQITGPGGMLLSMNLCGKKIIVGTKSNKLRSLTIPQVYLDELSS